MHPSLRRRVAAVTAVVFVVSVAASVAVDRWYAGELRRAERARVDVALQPYGNAVASAIGRHISRMAAVAAFVTSRRDYTHLSREFALYAGGVIANVPGVLSIQVIRDGRIVLVHPIAGNRTALGLSLRENPVQAIREGYRRALRASPVSIFGPTALVQGGEALVIDRRLTAPYDAKIELVSMLIDVKSVLRDLRLDSLPPGLALEVHASDGELVGAFGGKIPAQPVTIREDLPDGHWTVRGGPSAGWDSVVAPARRPVRLAATAIVLLLSLLAYQIAGREARLTDKVNERTASLRQLTEEQRAAYEALKTADQALAASESRLRLALSASRSATYEVTPGRGQMSWSPEAAPLLGLAAADMPATFADALRFVEAEDAVRLRDAATAAEQGPYLGTLEVRVNGADGMVRWLTVSLLSRTDETGAVRSIVGSITDTSARKALEERVLHAQKLEALGVLAGGIAHDFNNLLTVIVASGQLARAEAESSGSSSELREELDEILSASSRATVLTAQLLAFSRRSLVQPRRFDARTAVEEMLGLLRRLAGDHIRIEATLPDAPLPVYADEGRFSQIVMNLAVNARDAMADGGTLTISLTVEPSPPGPPLPGDALAEGPFVVLTVSDTGVGIDPAHLSLIFDPFFSTKPVGQGTGLGLATVYGIASQLGGTVRVASTPGKGARFDVYLPLAPERVEEHPEEHSPDIAIG